MKQTAQVPDFPEQELETLEVRVSQMNKIGKLKDQLIRKLDERDVIRKQYLEKNIAEAGLELKNLERQIGYNPFPSRPNVVLPQQPAMDTQSVAAGSEFTQATAVTDDKEEEKAASKEERKANEGPGTSNNIDDSFSTGFSNNSKPFVFNPNYNQA